MKTKASHMQIIEKELPLNYRWLQHPTTLFVSNQVTTKKYGSHQENANIYSETKQRQLKQFKLFSSSNQVIAEVRWPPTTVNKLLERRS